MAIIRPEQRHLRSIVTRASMLPPPESRQHPEWAQSWDYLTRLYTPAMIRYVRSVLGRIFDHPPGTLDADDIVQSYLTQALEKGWLARDAREIRCFRAYLQAQLRRFTVSFLRHAFAQKRVPPGVEPVEVLAGLGADDMSAAGAELDTAWVDAIRDQVLARLQEGSATYYEVVLDLLRTDGAGSADLAERIGRPKARMKDLRLRARRRFALLFYEELRRSVRDEEAYEDICRHLEPYLP
jgi:hypothetical protein